MLRASEILRALINDYIQTYDQQTQAEDPD